MSFAGVMALKNWLDCVERRGHLWKPARWQGNEAPNSCTHCGARENGPSMLDLVKDFPLPDFRR